jgi:hypothetical protein
MCGTNDIKFKSGIGTLDFDIPQKSWKLRNIFYMNSENQKAEGFL